MKIINRVLAVVLTLSVLLGLMTVPAWGFTEDVEGLPELCDPMADSDEYFFGVWDEAAQTWSQEGQINYAYSPDLEPVELAVKAGNYEAASTLLRDYYRNRKMDRPSAGGSRNTMQVNLWIDNIFYWDENPVTELGIGPEAEWYTVDIQAQVNAKKQSFLFYSRKKGTDSVYIYSRDTEYAPYLTMKINGQEVMVTANNDAHISAGANSNENFGKEALLKVSDNADDGHGEIADDTTCKTFIRFPYTDLINKNDKVTDAKIHFYAYADTTERKKDIVVAEAASQDFSEDTIRWSTTSHMTFCTGTSAFPEEFIHGKHYGSNFEVHARFYPIVPLINEYFYTGNEKYAYHGIRLVLDFAKKRPMVMYKDLQIGIQLTKITAAYLNLVDSPSMTPSASTGFLKHLLYNGNYMYDDKNFTSNMNYGMHATQGYYALVLNFPEFKAHEMWREKVHERVLILMNNLTHEDGTYFESDFGYATGSIGGFSTLMDYAKQDGWEIPDWYVERLRKLGIFLMNITMPNGRIQDWGDNGSGTVNSTISAILNNIDDPYMKYFVTNGQEGTEPDWTSWYYPDNHVGFSRSAFLDKNAVHAFYDNKAGGIHAHREGIHFTIEAYGNYLLTDTGCTSYDNTHPHFNWQRFRSISHNTVEINNTESGYSQDDKEIDAMGDEEMVINPLFDTFEAWSDANKQGGTNLFRHNRDITYIKPMGFFICSDYMQPLTGAAMAQKNKYNQAWHTLADAKLTIDPATKQARTNFVGAANLQIVPLDPEELNLPRDNGDVTPTLDDGYGYYSNENIRNCVSTKFVNFEKYDSGYQTFDTVLYPTKQTDKTNITTERLDTGTDRWIATAFKVNFNGNPEAKDAYYLLNRDESGTVDRYSFGEYASNGRLAYVQRDTNENISYLLLRRGSKLYAGSQELIDTFKTKVEDLSVAYNEGVTEIYGTNIESIPMQVYLPEGVHTVKVNGEPVHFQLFGNMALVNTDTIQFDSNYNDAGIPEINSQYIKLNSDDLTLEVAEATVFSGENWDFSITLPALVNGTIDGYSANKKIDFPQPVRLSIPAKLTLNTYSAAEVYYNDGSGYRPISESGGLITLEKEGGKSVIYLSQLYPLALSAKASSGGGTSGGGGGGGGGLQPSDGKYAGVTATPSPEPSATPSAEPSGQPEPGGHPFEDVKGHWAEDAVAALYEKEIVNGKSDTEYGPEQQVTRAEFAAFLARTFGLEQKEYQGIFQDVPEHAWYAEIVQAVYDSGIFTGDEENFRPEDPITRAEAAKTLVNAAETLGAMVLTDTGISQFADSAYIPSWAAEQVGKAAGASWVSGMPDGGFYPNKQLTRAEAAVMLYHVIETEGNKE